MTEVNNVGEKVVETEHAKSFRQECTENVNMAEEDYRQWENEKEKMAAVLLDYNKMLKKIEEKELKICRSPLSRAVWDSNLGLVQNLVNQQGIDINQADGDDQTPLGIAISKATGHNFDIVRLLVESGANVNKKSKATPPICAACNKTGNMELIQYMVEHGADTKGALLAAAQVGDIMVVQYLMGLGGLDINNDGNIDHKNSPLYYAAFGGYFEVVRFFVEQGASLKGALHAACSSHRFQPGRGDALAMISYLLEQGMDIDGFHYQMHNIYCTPLHSAILDYYVGDDCLIVIKYLILRGADKHKLSPKTGATLVHAAVSQTGYQSLVPILEYLHEQGLDLNKVDNNQTSPLQHAIKHCNGEEKYLLMTVRFLVEHGADVNHPKPNPFANPYLLNNPCDSPPLIQACIEHYSDVCRFLVEHGADVNQIDEYGRTPLDAVCSRGFLDICQVLVERGAETDRINDQVHYSRRSPWTSLKLAASGGHLEIVEFLVKSGVDVERDGSRYYSDGSHEHSTTALYDAASSGYLSVVRFLFENCSADVEKMDTDGNTAVFAAASKGHLDVLKYLLEVAGARQQVNRYGCTLLNAACRGKNAESEHLALGVVQYLCEKGFDRFQQTDDRGQDPLFHASHAGRTEIVQYLLEVAKAKIDLDRVNDQGRTALHAAAVRHDKVSIVQCLVEHGAKVDMTDHEGVTALCLAASSGNVGAVEYLIDHGAELNKTANDGNTPLHVAARNANVWSRSFTEVVSMLLAYGASLKARNNEDLLPIDVAANDEIRRLIDEEFIRRRDHGYKRGVIPHPTAAEEEEQESKRPRLEVEGDNSSSSSSSGQANASSTQEEKEKMEEDEDSEPSDEGEDW